MPNLPLKHHFIPEFYLKRWRASDGQLCEFSRPHIAVVPRRVHPSSTGFELRGYELKGFNPEVAQQVETHFFKPADTWAAEALVKLEKDGPDHTSWNLQQRSSWSRFMLSLGYRCPEDIELLRATWLKELKKASPEERAAYDAKRRLEDPENWSDLIEQSPLYLLEKGMFELFFRLVDNRRVGKAINNMFWVVLEFPDSAYELMTSDRPLIFMLQGADKHISLPIGPKRLFIASPNVDFIRAVSALPRTQLGKFINRHVVNAARRFVYATNDSSIAFVRKHFGKRLVPSLMEVGLQRFNLQTESV